MSTATPAQSTSVSRLDVTALRCVIIGLAFACLAEFWYTNAHTDDFRLQSPAFTPRLWNLYLTLKLVSVIGLMGIWNWHKWGLKVLTVAGIGMLFMEFFAAEAYSLSFLVTSLRIPLALAAVWYLAQRSSSRFV